MGVGRLRGKLVNNKVRTPLRFFSEANIALSRRPVTKLSSKLQRVFTGEGDVQIVFLYNENVLMQGKNVNEKGIELLNYIDGASSHHFHDKLRQLVCY